MRYAFAILGVCLAVVFGAAGTIHLNAKRHHTTWQWEYDVLMRRMGVDRVTDARRTTPVAAYEADVRRGAVEHQQTLDHVLAEPERRTGSGARRSRADRLTGGMGGG